VLKSDKPLHCESYDKRTDRWFDMFCFPYGHNQVAVLFRDITDRKKAEKDWFEKQLELNLIFDSSPTIIFYKNKVGKFIQANRAFAQALNVPKEKLLGKTVFDIYSTEIARGMTDDDAEVFESKLPKLGIVEPYESPTGLRWIKTDKIPTLDENGDVNGLIGFSEEITEQKKAELELNQRYNLLESISENIDAGLTIIDKNYHIVWANKALRNVGANVGELCYENLGHTKTICPNCGVKKIFEQNISADIHEYENITSKGETHWIELRATPLKNENGNITSALELAVPITERKNAKHAQP